MVYSTLTIYICLDSRIVAQLSDMRAVYWVPNRARDEDVVSSVEALSE